MKLEKERAEIVAKYDKVCLHELVRLPTLNLRVLTGDHETLPRVDVQKHKSPVSGVKVFIFLHSGHISCFLCRLKCGKDDR